MKKREMAVDGKGNQTAARDAVHDRSVHTGHISGGTNILGTNGDVHVQVSAPTRRSVRVVVNPGEGCLSENQKSALTLRRDEWMALHAALKKNPLSHGRAWGLINRFAGVTSYHLIPVGKFDSVMDFVQKQMAMLRQMASAPSKDKGWRAKRIGAIKARCKNQLGDADAYKPYIAKRFKAVSLSDLATDDLQATYAYIMAKKAGT